MGRSVIAAAHTHLSHRDAYHPDVETSPIRPFGEVSKALIEALAPKFSPESGSGTPPAINYPTSGVAGDSAQQSRKGGALNSADRQSDALTKAQVANLKEASRHAEQINLPFNRMITIHWEAAGVPLDDMAKATGQFLDLMTKTIKRHNGQTAWLWVHENGDRKGGHCHLLAHVPPELVARVTKLQRRWLRTITGKPYKKRVIRSKPIGGRLRSETGNAAHHAVNLEASLRYLLKGANNAAAKAFGLSLLEEGGLVVGKRCGTSQNIGAKARQSTQLD